MFFLVASIFLNQILDLELRSKLTPTIFVYMVVVT